jgi:hypothetical protein
MTSTLYMNTLLLALTYLVNGVSTSNNANSTTVFIYTYYYYYCYDYYSYNSESYVDMIYMYYNHSDIYIHVPINLFGNNKYAFISWNRFCNTNKL